MNVPVARRQLLARPGRSLAGLAGIAVALLLVLALKAILAGAEERLTSYIDRTGADVFVAQRGVDTMHMTQSALPAAVADAIAAVPGVAEARPILYVPALAERGEKRANVYIVGEDRPSITLVEGRAPRAGEVVLDRGSSLGAPLGTTVHALGARFRVVGAIEGTASLASSIALTDRSSLGRLVGSDASVSYVLVDGKPGVSAEELATRIGRTVPGVSASTREQFARSERRVVGDMATDIVRAMVLVGFVIGVAVAGLVAYGLTLPQLRDYAVLRALGLRARGALALVLAQVGALVALGFVLAVALAALLAERLPQLSPTLALALRPADVGLALAVAALVTAAAAAFPVVRVARVDPASVFRR